MQVERRTAAGQESCGIPGTIPAAYTVPSISQEQTSYKIRSRENRSVTSVQSIIQKKALLNFSLLIFSQIGKVN